MPFKDRHVTWLSPLSEVYRRSVKQRQMQQALIKAAIRTFTDSRKNSCVKYESGKRKIF